MINPTTKAINTISMIISIIVFSLLYIVQINYNKMQFNVSFNSQEYNLNISNNISNSDSKNIEEQDNEIIKEQVSYNEPNWIIKIPEIDLVAEINEGTSNEVMNRYVGHFNETNVENGNVGLAAHNRGYPVNYFQDLKKLKIGSEITYKHNDFEMTYIIETIEIIENTNWDYLQETEDNRITLITCVENEPKYRRCIQGVEKVESEEF